MATDLASLSSESKQTVSDIICKVIAETETEIIKPTVQQLALEAKNFKKNIINYRKNLQDLNNIDQQKRNIYKEEEGFRTDQNIQGIIQSVQTDKNYTNEHDNLYKRLQSSNYMSTILHFQDVLNNFLGQRMVLTLVNNETGTIYFSITENYDKYLYLTKDFVARFKKNIQTMVKQMENNNEIIGQINIDSLITAEQSTQTIMALQHVQWAHQSALWRINRSFEVHKRVGVILWHSVQKRSSGNQWYGVTANRGVIAEAYAEILIKRQENAFYNNGQHIIEPLLDVFILEYMNHVTNAAGAVFGDISDLSNQLDYAVKTSNASLDLEQQLMTYADIIINNNSDSEEVLRKKIEAQKIEDAKGEPIMAQGIERVSQALGKFAQDEINQIVRKYYNYNNAQSNWWDKR